MEDAHLVTIYCGTPCSHGHICRICSTSHCCSPPTMHEQVYITTPLTWHLFAAGLLPTLVTTPLVSRPQQRVMHRPSLAQDFFRQLIRESRHDEALADFGRDIVPRASANTNKIYAINRNAGTLPCQLVIQNSKKPCTALAIGLV